MAPPAQPQQMSNGLWSMDVPGYPALLVVAPTPSDALRRAKAVLRWANSRAHSRPQKVVRITKSRSHAAPGVAIPPQRWRLTDLG